MFCGQFNRHEKVSRDKSDNTIECSVCVRGQGYEWTFVNDFQNKEDV